MPLPGRPRNPHELTTFVRFHEDPIIPWIRDQAARVRLTFQAPGAIRRWAIRPRPMYVGGATGQELNWTTNQLNRESFAGAVVTTTPHNRIMQAPWPSAGNQRSRPMLRPVLEPSIAAAAPRKITAGNAPGRPVLRVRIPSFGSRVPALNADGPGTGT